MPNDMDDILDMTHADAAQRLNRMYHRLHEEWKQTPRTAEALKEHAQDISALNLAMDALLGKKSR